MKQDFIEPREEMEFDRQAAWTQPVAVEKAARAEKTPEQIAAAKAERRALKASKRESKEKRLAAIAATVREPEYMKDERPPVKAELRERQGLGRTLKKTKIDARVRSRLAAAREMRLITLVEALEAKAPQIALEVAADETPRDSAKLVEQAAKAEWRARVGSKQESGIGWNTHRRSEAANARALPVNVGADARETQVFRDMFRDHGNWHPLDREQVNSKRNRQDKQARMKAAKHEEAETADFTRRIRSDHSGVKPPPSRGRR